MSKVAAMDIICATLTGRGNSLMIAENERYDHKSYTNPIVISAFDNMAARKVAFENWVAQEHRCIFIDGRLLAEDYQIYAVTEGREDDYRKTLFSDDEIRAEPCTLKSTTHCSLGIASDIVALLTNYATNVVSMKEYGMEMRDVPFSVSKSIPLFDYRVTLEANGGTTDSSRSSKRHQPYQEEVKSH